MFYELRNRGTKSGRYSRRSMESFQFDERHAFQDLAPKTWLRGRGAQAG